MGLFNSKKADLLEWQNLLSHGNTKTLKLTEDQLRKATRPYLQRLIEICQDCARLINTTVNPDVFFKRYQMLLEKSEEIARFEKFYKFSGASPTKELEQIRKQKQSAISNLIDRCINQYENDAANLKTEKAKLNNLIKMRDSLRAYYIEFNEENREKVECYCSEKTGANE